MFNYLKKAKGGAECGIKPSFKPSNPLPNHQTPFKPSNPLQTIKLFYMKHWFTFFCLCLAFSNPAFSQNADPCIDIVYLKSGSVYQGRITAQDTNKITIRTWNGIEMKLPENSVRKVVQRCKKWNRTTEIRPYTFKEKGWYHATRVALLTGQQYNGLDNTVGFLAQHSSGYQFGRLLGAGLGVGAEMFSPTTSNDASTYPVFAELRGYFTARRISPFYAVGGGWAFAGTGSEGFNGWQNTWKGGGMWMAQLGYRIGNHFFMYGGVRFQRKTKNAVSGPDSRVNKILHKRLEAGFGLLL
jgi:hypothetical protein